VIFFRGNPLRLLTTLFLCLVSAQLSAQNEGLLNLAVEEDSSKVFLHFDKLPADFLYVPALQSGVGSNDLGLDRGQLSHTRWVRFERYGNRLLLLEPNLKFRAETENTFEQRAVNEAFAQSVLAGFPVENVANGGIRIDLSPLLLSDVTRIAVLITEREQGTFEMDPDRSVVDTSGIRNFPQNTLIPVVVTLKGSKPGDFIRDVTPTPDSLSVRVVHQFIQVPANDYQPRRFHPRSGYFVLQYRDYAALLEGADLVIRELLQAQRLSRLAEQHALDPGLPGITDVMDALLEVSWRADTPGDSYLAAIKAEVEWRLLRGLMALSADQSAGDVTRERGTAALISLANDLQSRVRRGDAHASVVRHEILKFLDRQPAAEEAAPDPVPPGSPIG